MLEGLALGLDSTGSFTGVYAFKVNTGPSVPTLTVPGTFTWKEGGEGGN